MRETLTWLRNHFMPAADVREHSMTRFLLLAALVGVVAGLGAIVFQLAVDFVKSGTLGYLAGYVQGGPLHEKDAAEIFPWVHFESSGHIVPWLLVVLPAVGGLLSGLIVFNLAPEAEGHGTDAAIKAYHFNRGIIPLRVPIVKLVASAITLGTGGSGGREGPIAQIGAGFGSFLATQLGLSDAERRFLLTSGLGAGIGAIFHAPLAGAIFSIEVLYQDPDFESESLIPAFIATTVSYAVFSYIFGFDAFEPLFFVAAELENIQPLRLFLPFAVLAVIMAFMSWVYVRSFYGIHHLFQKLPLPNWFKPAIGGALTGVVALLLFVAFSRSGGEGPRQVLNVLAGGYGFLQELLASNTDSFGMAVLLAVGLGKIVTTGLTIGSGGSGGVFGPSMVIGGSFGAFVGILMHRMMPGVVYDYEVVIFAILGMAAFFAASANTPVSTLIIVSELTNGYALLLPSMWVCALAYLCSRGWTLYREQVANRIESPAHRGDFIVDILKDLTVEDALGEQHRQFRTVTLDMPLSELAHMITSTMQSSFPTLDEQGNYHGLFSINDIRQFLYDSDLGPLAVAEDLATPGVEPLTTETNLSEALSRFAQSRFDELPIVEATQPQQIVAMMRRQDLISLHNRRLLELRSRK